MAKKSKKNENLTLEEKLDQALIPNWDEPYNLPNNWCWTYWGNCGQFVAGGAFKEKYQGQKGLPIPFYKVGSLKYSDGFGYLYDDTNTIDEETRNKLKVSLIPVNSIIFAKIGEAIRLNRRSLNELPCCIDNNLMAFIPDDKCYYKYVYYWSKSVDLYGYANATTVPAIRKTDLEMIPLPLAPYESQVKIVGHIENLFVKLDEAKEKAQEVVDGFENRKAAILHKAFSGELTAKWRENNGISFDGWEHHKFSDLCKIVRGGSPRPAGSTEFYGGDIPFMKVADITRISSPYVESTEHFIKPAGLKKTRMVKANTLLLTNSGATLGVPAICTFDTTFNDGIAAFLDLDPESLLFYYYFWTMKTPELRAINKGAAQPNLNTDIIGAVELYVPSKPEQREIVNILESLISKEQQSKEMAESVVEQIDAMKKAILARAFRGEVGTNDPDEESAVELLKKILETDFAENDVKVSSVRVTIPKEIFEQLSTELERKIIKSIIKNNGSANFDEILAVSSKKFDILETVRKLERKKLIFREESGEYTLKG